MARCWWQWLVANPGLPSGVCTRATVPSRSVRPQRLKLAGIERTAARDERRRKTTHHEECRLHGQYLTAATNPVAPPATGATVTGLPSK